MIIPNIWKITNVPNHQPDSQLMTINATIKLVIPTHLAKEKSGNYLLPTMGHRVSLPSKLPALRADRRPKIWWFLGDR